MSYDPTKIEEWVVSSSGFWHKGTVNTTKFIVQFTGTWEQVNSRMLQMREMEKRHAQERAELEAKHLEERKMFW
jgi:hypothetical protein